MNSRRHEWINGGDVREQVRNQRNLQKNGSKKISKIENSHFIYEIVQINNIKEKSTAAELRACATLNDSHPHLFASILIAARTSTSSSEHSLYLLASAPLLPRRVNCARSFTSAFFFLAVAPPRLFHSYCTCEHYKRQMVARAITTTNKNNNQN